jgi:hypothetical protein
VNLVIHPPTFGGAATVAIAQDGKPLPADDAGDDVTAGTVSTITVDTPRMYRLVSNRDIDRHELTLSTTSDGVALYAFTFTSCVMPE